MLKENQLILVVRCEYEQLLPSGYNACIFICIKYVVKTYPSIDPIAAPLV